MLDNAYAFADALGVSAIIVDFDWIIDVQLLPNEIFLSNDIHEIDILKQIVAKKK